MSQFLLYFWGTPTLIFIFNMKASVLFASSLLSAYLVLVYAKGRHHAESSRRQPKFLSFNSDDGNIDVSFWSFFNFNNQISCDILEFPPLNE